MIIRIVKMTFREDFVDEFLARLDQRKQGIRDFDGCHYLQILQDKNHPNIIFSHSHWNSEEALNRYRHSDFFAETWTFTKSGFIAKPEAWSLDSLSELK